MINLSVLFCRNPDIDENIQVHRSVLIRKQKKKEKRKKKRKRKTKTKERKEEEHKKKEMKKFDRQSLILGYPLKSKI